MKRIFDKINQVAVLSNELRFKIVLALFNSSVKIKNNKLGTQSHTFSELREIVDVETNDLSYHLSILLGSRLIEKAKEDRKYYRITDNGEEMLNSFGVTKKLVAEMGEKLL